VGYAEIGARAMKSLERPQWVTVREYTAVNNNLNQSSGVMDTYPGVLRPPVSARNEEGGNMLFKRAEGSELERRQSK
jgi:hypothetical protein